MEIMNFRQLIPEKLQEEKADVYGLGVLLLELLTGRKPVDPSAPHNQQSLVDWVSFFSSSV